MKKRNASPKYTVHHLGTSDIYTANTDAELAAILDILGNDADVYKA